MGISILMVNRNADSSLCLTREEQKYSELLDPSICPVCIAQPASLAIERLECGLTAQLQEDNSTPMSQNRCTQSIHSASSSNVSSGLESEHMT